LLNLEDRRQAILRGEKHPEDADEQLGLADLCHRYKQLYAAGARFYAGVFAGGAAWASTRTYAAACCAALAADGKGKDAAQLKDREKAVLRKQSLAWLNGALKSQRDQLKDADAGTRQSVRQTLQHWLKDVDLRSVRDQQALARLPAAERESWQQLWADVDSLLQKTN
jgi:hypothetical protein